MAGTIKVRTLSDGTEVFDAYSKASGRRKFLKTHPTRHAADMAIRDWEAEVRKHNREIERGGHPAPLHARTYGAAAKEFLASLEPPGIRGHRSRRKYEQQIRLHVLPRFKDAPITSITHDDVIEWHTALTSKAAQGSQCEEGATLTPQSANTAKIALSASLKFAVRKRWIAVNPAAGVSDLESVEREFQWIHNPEDVTALLAACASDDVRDFVGLAVGTGMRAGEILNLRWSDVALANRSIRVARGTKSGPTKSGKARDVPLLDTALAIIKARKLRRGDSKASGLVFPSPSTGEVRNLSSVRDQFDRAVEASGIHVDGMPKIRIHDLRHTFASQWVSNGGDIYRLSKVLGHATVRTTEEYYARFRRDAWEQDYQRVSFALPSMTDNVIKLAAV